MVITQEQAIDMMNEIAFSIVRTDIDKYLDCTETQCEVLNSYVRSAFVSICEILGIEDVIEKN